METIGSSFLGFLFRILPGNPKNELLWRLLSKVIGKTLIGRPQSRLPCPKSQLMDWCASIVGFIGVSGSEFSSWPFW